MFLGLSSLIPSVLALVQRPDDVPPRFSFSVFVAILIAFLLLSAVAFFFLIYRTQFPGNSPFIQDRSAKPLSDDDKENLLDRAESEGQGAEEQTSLSLIEISKIIAIPFVGPLLSVSRALGRPMLT